MSKYIEVTLVVEIPDNVTADDIQDWVDVELAECGGMKLDNPIIDNYEVVEHYWSLTE